MISYIFGFEMSTKVKSFVVPAFACIGVLISAHWLRPPSVPLGEDIQKEIARIEAYKPEILLIGNSYLAAAVNFATLSRLTGRRSMVLKRPGSASACWYLLVKNVLRPARHIPQVLLVYFMDNDLTLPAFRTGGRDRSTRLEPLSTPDESVLEQLAYRQNKGMVFALLERCWPILAQREQIKKNIEQGVAGMALSLFQKDAWLAVEKTFNRVFADRRMNMVLFGQRQMEEESAKFAFRNQFDFPNQVRRSFLPHIIELARGKGCQLVMVRHRCRYHAEGIPESGSLKEYMAHLRDYLAERKIIFLDFSRERSISLKHFDSGDHFNGEQVGFTSLLSARLLPYLPPSAGLPLAPDHPAGAEEENN